MLTSGVWLNILNILTITLLQLVQYTAKKRLVLNWARHCLVVRKIVTVLRGSWEANLNSLTNPQRASWLTYEPLSSNESSYEPDFFAVCNLGVIIICYRIKLLYTAMYSALLYLKLQRKAVVWYSVHDSSQYVTTLYRVQRPFQSMYLYKVAYVVSYNKRTAAVCRYV